MIDPNAERRATLQRRGVVWRSVRWRGVAWFGAVWCVEAIEVRWPAFALLISLKTANSIGLVEGRGAGGRGGGWCGGGLGVRGGRVEQHQPTEVALL